MGGDAPSGWIGSGSAGSHHADLSAPESAAIRAMLDAPSAPTDDQFGDDDWRHGLGASKPCSGGRPDRARLGRQRDLHVGDRPFPDRLCRGGRDADRQGEGSARSS
jgi:hypothetical protein